MLWRGFCPGEDSKVPPTSKPSRDYLPASLVLANLPSSTLPGPWWSPSVHQVGLLSSVPLKRLLAGLGEERHLGLQPASGCVRPLPCPISSYVHTSAQRATFDPAQPP